MSVAASLALGNVAVGQTVVKNLTIHNNTGKINSLVISGATSSDPAEYALSGTGTCGAIPVTVAPRKSCTLGVAFTPNALGARKATLTLDDNAKSSPQTVALSGAGLPDVVVSPDSIAYGTVKLSEKKSKAVIVKNAQPVGVALSKSITGTNAGNFAVTGGTCSSNLAAKANCTYIVTFTAGAAGARSATFSVTASPDPLGPHNVSLLGTGRS